jgi:hypothetical protein
MRNPNDPIPGFEEEFTGTVGKEKRIHRYMFNGVDLSEAKTWYVDGSAMVLLTPKEARKRGLKKSEARMDKTRKGR